MKAQITLITKPMILVLTISLLIVFIYTVYSEARTERIKEREIDLRSIATDTLLLLANSEQCIAYRTEFLGGYANIVNVERLESFSREYDDIEPICARNFDFGWRASVIEVDKNGESKKSWGFGASNFSKGLAVRNGIKTNMPIAIRYSKYDIRPGILEIQLMDGELEELAGFLDKVCHLNQESGKDISLTYPAFLEKNQLCIGSGTEKACRELLCKVDMPNLNAGNYYLIAGYKDNVVKVNL